MAMRLQEIHPAMVHFPIALLPTALAADALGRLTGSEVLLETGRRLMPVAAVSAALAGVAGLVAQESSNVPEEAHDVLVSHRNLNLGLIGLAALLAKRRVGERRPSLGYLLAGFAGVAAMTYSAYLGGHMVYEHGVGVKPAGGVLDGQAPELRLDTAGEVLRLAGRHVAHGARHTLEHLREGEVVPTLTGDGAASGGAAESETSAPNGGGAPSQPAGHSAPSDA